MLVVAIVAVGSASWAWRANARRLSMVAAKRELVATNLLRIAASLEEKNRWRAETIARLKELGYQSSGRLIKSFRRTMVDNDDLIGGCRRSATSAHASAVSYRRAARYPWLRVRLVEPANVADDPPN
jgi:hypothetical protein